MMGWDRSDQVEPVRALWCRVRLHLAEREEVLLDRFSARWESSGAQRVHALQPAMLARLEAAQRTLLRHLDGSEDSGPVGRWQVAMGRSLCREGLPQRTFVRANALFLQILLEDLTEPLSGDPGALELIRVFVRAAYHDAAQVLEAWDEEHARTSRELERARAALAAVERLDSAGRLAAGLAHDLNNVLGTIFVAVEALRAAGASGEELALLDGAATRGRTLVERLVGLARRPAASAEPVDALAVLAAFEPFLARMIRPGVDLRATLPPGPALVRIDPTDLERLVMNPVLNAQEPAVLARTIGIRASAPRTPRPGEVPGLDRPCLLIEVEDDGRGMAEDVRRRAFEPLFTTRGAGRGTGLGLAIVWSIVRGCGGSASIESEEGVGTSVRLWLPLSEGPALGRPLPPPRLRRGDGQRILLVEDDGAVARASERMLRASGYQVVVAQTVSEARHRAVEAPPDLLLVDCVLSDGSGVELILSLRAAGVDAPMFLRTGLTRAQADPSGRLPADVPVLSKAAPVADLLAAIHATFDGAGG